MDAFIWLGHEGISFMLDRPLKEDNTSKKECKSVQLKHLLLDVDFFDKPKIKALTFRFGKSAGLWLIQTYLQMSRATNGLVDNDLLLGLAAELGIADGTELVSYCLQKGLINKKADGFSNVRVDEDQEALAERQENWRNQKRSRKDSLENPSGILQESPRSVNVQTTEDLNIEDLNIEDLEKSHPQSRNLKFGEYCEMSEIEYDQFCVTKGIDFLNRCFEKANAWVRESRKTPEFPDRKRRAKDSAALFQNWVFKAIEKENSTGNDAKTRPKEAKPTTVDLNPEIFKELFP